MKLLFLWVALAFWAPVHSQHTLSGLVTDAASHSPIPGAAIYIPDVKKGTATDAEGRYLIDNLPRGAFLVEITFVGYSSLIQRVQISGPTVFNAELHDAVVELNEVVVTGMSHSSELRNNPLPIATVNNRELTENTSTNIIDNISKKAGVNQITTGPAISKPVIRGLGYNRIITLFDGIRQEGQQWGDEHGIEVDEYSVDRVEIVKGAGSVMYGSDGLGGVLNLLGPKPVTAGSIVGKWSSNYQTNNGMIGNSLMTAGNISGLYWQLRGSWKDAHDYSNAYDGHVFNSGFRERDVNGFVGMTKSWGYTQFNASSFHQYLGLVEGDRDSTGRFTRLKNIGGQPITEPVSDQDLNTYHLFVPRQEIHHLRLSNTSNIYLGSSRIQVNAGYQRNQRMEFGDAIDEQKKNLYFDLNVINYNITYFFQEGKKWQVSAGTSGMSQHSLNKGVEFLIPEYRSFDWGAFGFARRKVGKVDLAAGLRGDQRRLSVDALYLDENGNPTTNTSANKKFESASLVFGNFSGSAGITYPVDTHLIAKLNASRGFRAPNIAELASNGRHEGSLRYEYGNYNLKAESSLQVDASLLFSSTHISAELSIFQNEISNYIYTRKLLSRSGADSIPDPSEPVPAYQYVQGTARLRGGEFLIDFHPHPLDWLHFENSFSFVHAVNTSAGHNDSTRYLPYIPAPRFQSELRGNIASLGKRIVNAYAKIEFVYVGAQHEVLLENHTETPTPSYALWNAGAGADAIGAKGTTLFSIFISINNIFDAAYQNHLSRLKYGAENLVTGRTGVFNMGRNISLRLVVPFTVLKKR